jgi:hypothetical protein
MPTDPGPLANLHLPDGYGARITDGEGPGPDLVLQVTGPIVYAAARINSSAIVESPTQAALLQQYADRLVLDLAKEAAQIKGYRAAVIDQLKAEAYDGTTDGLELSNWLEAQK